MNFETLQTLILETPRLRLRPMTEEDAAMVVRWRNSDHVAIMSRETTQGSISIKTHLDWFTRTRSSRLDYIIEIRDYFQSIGSLSLTCQALVDCEPCAELGKYIGDPQALGKGYAYEASHRWLEYAFSTLGLECVFARTRRINIANIKINKKLGFWIESLPVQMGPELDEWIFMRINRAAWLRKGTNHKESLNPAPKQIIKKQ